MSQLTLKKLSVSELPPDSQAQISPCCLYIVQEGGEPHFKIGIAGHPVRRLIQLQCGNRRRLKIVAAYEGTRASCLFVERTALRFFRAPQGSEWVYAESLTEIVEYVDSFLETEGEA